MSYIGNSYLEYHRRSSEALSLATAGACEICLFVHFSRRPFLFLHLTLCAVINNAVPYEGDILKREQADTEMEINPRPASLHQE